MSGRRPVLGGAVRGERVRLRDGSVVLIRLVQSGDAPLLADGFAHLSSESRELRFLRGKANLTPAELRYLTAIDHHDHEAVGALNPVDGRGLGVARYIRDAKDPEGAEVAVTVIDEWQRRGLGIELLKRLADRARQEGIRHFTALVSDDNAGVVALLQENRIDVRVINREAGAVEYQITLPPRGLGDELHALLRAFGRRQLRAPASIRDTLAVLTPEASSGTPEAPPGMRTPPARSQNRAAD
jgi:GNAT superfamily N-acetyltransferase